MHFRLKQSHSFVSQDAPTVTGTCVHDRLPGLHCHWLHTVRAPSQFTTSPVGSQVPDPSHVFTVHVAPDAVLQFVPSDSGSVRSHSTKTPPPVWMHSSL